MILASSCAHRITVVSEPVGADVVLRGRELGPTPVEVVLWTNPFVRPRATLSFPGYRRVRVDLSRNRRPLRRFRELLVLRWRRAFALVSVAEHEVLMVPNHGPAGTWTPEDVD